MRKFKHKITGDIVEELSTSPINNTYHIIGGITIHKRFVENSNDWEEIVEKDYEILSFKYKDTVTNRNEGLFFFNIEYQDGIDEESMLKDKYCKIHSVKRLSDGEIFTIGDKCRFEIKKFHISKDTIVATGSSTNNTLDWSSPLCNLKHEKKPLFTTEDGVDIYAGDLYYFVNNYNLKLSPPKEASNQEEEAADICKNFSTKEAAENYIICNKPCLSLREILEGYCKIAPKDSPLYNKFKIRLKNLIKDKL